MKTYKIVVKDGWITKLKIELAMWGVAEDKYQLDDNTIITTDTNVVDVATETFINNRHLISIESIPNG